MNKGSVRTTSDLRRWLKRLALPTWAKAPPAIIMRLTFLSALGLLVASMLNEVMGSTEADVSVTKVALPLGVIVVALVFGNGGARKHGPHNSQVVAQELVSRFVRTAFKAETLNV